MIYCFLSVCRCRILYYVISFYICKEIYVLVFLEDNNNIIYVNIELYLWFDFEKKN